MEKKDVDLREGRRRDMSKGEEEPGSAEKRYKSSFVIPKTLKGKR